MLVALSKPKARQEGGMKLDKMARQTNREATEASEGIQDNNPGPVLENQGPPGRTEQEGWPGSLLGLQIHSQGTEGGKLNMAKKMQQLCLCNCWADLVEVAKEVSKDAQEGIEEPDDFIRPDLFFFFCAMADALEGYGLKAAAYEIDANDCQVARLAYSQDQTSTQASLIAEEGDEELVISRVYFEGRITGPGVLK